ncbi:PIN domain-containing protein [Halogeometricum sp. S1BR25-6]|uniref:PIN domain-containing protein n=1 Tax=Halogeometricum salsisoli TaxID=2950536 RepID=A0ABU2GCC0_9EURY|nr:PIN domain-containing protein [Halogeometricum sp. S1BR25-6]MDS0297773.1 PIN domain-containing protein [Halogeometricum sp. S1BR25-6]
MEPDSSFVRSTRSDSTNSHPNVLKRTSKNGWTASVYLDTDVVLAVLKADDWLSSVVDLDVIDDPKTSVSTCIEVQYAMQDEWSRERLTTVHEALQEEGIELVPLETEHVAAGGALQRRYDRLNLFDAIHLGAADVLGETLVSTDTLYPTIEEIDTVDPRDLRDSEE